ncbi:MAG: ABC transporter permease [Clostridia bacterium]|nr:ABC transporter permease [Clostridia bacterium]
MKKFFERYILSSLKGVGKFLLAVVKNPKGRRGVILVGIVVLAAIFAPYLTPYELDDYNIANGLAKPSLEHLLGTDKNGIDILTQLLYGARISLIIGVTTGLCVTFLGATLGVVSAYFGKVSAAVILNIINVLLVIPTTPLMMIMSNLSSSYIMMIAIFTLVGWCGTARMVRAQVLSITNMNYIRAAELAGGSKTYIMFKHILPSVAHLLIMNCALSCAGFMIAEAGLSFIGLGDPSVMSWGKILVAAEASAFTSGLWAWVIAPGVAIFITVFGFMQIGYALEEILNPKMKRKKDKKKDGLSPEAAAKAVFKEIVETGEEEAEKLKKEFLMSEDKNG